LVILYFKARSHYVAQTGLEIAILLPQPPPIVGITDKGHHSQLKVLFSFEIII
jgi:hypothetical protein